MLSLSPFLHAKNAQNVSLSQWKSSSASSCFLLLLSLGAGLGLVNFVGPDEVLEVLGLLLANAAVVVLIISPLCSRISLGSAGIGGTLWSVVGSALYAMSFPTCSAACFTVCLATEGLM